MAAHAAAMESGSATIDSVAAVVPAPNQIPIFEELEGTTPPRRRHLRIQPPLLADLTARLRRAVTWGEGPLLVVAGAGTGKTTVLTRRIAWLIAEQRAKPSEILALTFTERAAAEMQERVDQLVPYGYADSVICTFHAFGDRLIREHALSAGLSDQVAVLSRPEQVTFLREHLDELPLDRYRPLGDPTRFLSVLATHFSRARDEDASPAEYCAAADRIAARAAADPDDAALAEEARRQQELAAAYATYERLLRASDRIDFGDQVALALRLLREHPDVLDTERSRYRYILVDEFQDTNHAQFELVKLLAPTPSGNVTVVGDDDQSIYRFRGAALSNILGFRAAYPKTGRVVLTDNFRSPQPVLDAAYRLIRHNDPDRLEVRERIDKRLKARGPGKGAGPAAESAVRGVAFATTSDEADGVAEAIAASLSAGRRTADHAILVRGNRDADPYLRALSLRRIPWRFSGTAGLYRQPEVRVLLSFLRALNDPEDSVSLYDLATSDIFGLAPDQASRALNRASRRHLGLEVALRQGLADPERATLRGPAAAIVERLISALDAHRELAARLDAGEILYRFVTSTGWLARLALEARDSGPERLQNVARLFDILRRASTILRDPRLPFLVARLDVLIQAGDDPATADADTDASEAVHVLTCHKAKGLEFPIVFMVGMAQDRFPTRARREAVNLPDELVREVAVDGDYHLAEERRLCYVGMTRAGESLVMSWARDEGERPRRPSQFLLEALDLGPALPADFVRPSPMERIERLRPPAEAAPTRPIPSRPGLVEDPITLSYGQVSDYTDCPARYRYAHVIRLPTPVSHPLVVGRALHVAVQAFHRAQMAGSMLSLEELHADLDRNWESTGFVTRAHEDSRRVSALAALTRFWEEQQTSPAPVIGVEQEFAFRFGPDRVRGRIDRIDRDPDGSIGVVDYKSGDVHDPATAARRSRESLQLAMYALAWEADHGQPPDRLALHFLESGEVGVSQATPARLEKARAQIAATAAGIRAGQFEANPGPMRCASCPFRTICPDAAR